MRLPRTALTLVSASLVCAPAGASVEAQELRETRTLALSEPQLQDLLLDLGAAADIGTSEIERALGVVRVLRMGDEVQTYLLGGRGTLSSPIYLKVVDDATLLTSVRAAGASFDSVAAVIHRHMLRLLLPTKGAVTVSAHEGRTEGVGRGIDLMLRTTGEYSCTGHLIEADVQQSDRSIVVNVLGVMPPASSCGLAITPAHSTHTMQLQPDAYALTVQYTGHSDSYMLVITESSVRLTPSASGRNDW